MMTDTINKSIILIGPSKSGKKTFIDSLGFYEMVNFGTNYINTSHRRKPYLNLRGQKSNQYFHVMLPFEGKPINLRIVKCRELEFNSENRDDESCNSIDEFLYSLGEDFDENFNSIFYFTDGNSVRLENHDAQFFKKLASFYGESILKNLTILQSFSNEIKDPDFEFEQCRTRKEIKKQVENFDIFYNDRIKSRTSEIYEELKNNTNEIRRRFPNCPNFEKSQINLLDQISYLDFGKISIKIEKEERTKETIEESTGMVKEEKEVIPVYDLTISSLPGYPVDMVKAYKSIYKKDLENYEWLARFIEKIYSANNTFNFNEIEKEISRIKEVEKKARRNLEVTKQAVENTVKKFKDNADVMRWKSIIGNAINGISLLGANSNLLKNNSITSDEATGSINHILRMIGDNLTDTDSQISKNFFQEVQNQEVIIKLEKYGETE